MFAICAGWAVLFVMMCGMAEAATYDYTITVTPANDDQWSMDLSNNVSNVAGNIIVTDGAVLNVENATINMDSTDTVKRMITVQNGGVMNINDSTITHKHTSHKDYYGWKYESGSGGNVTNSTIECCIYNSGFSIETNEDVNIFDCTFRHGDGVNHVGGLATATHGIYLHSASNASIRDCTIEAGHSKNYNYKYRYWYGIRIDNSNINTIQNITIAAKSSYFHGVYIQNSDNNILNNISITREAYSVVGYDAVFMESSSNNTLNDFSIAGSKNRYGIYLFSSANENNITNCTFTSCSSISLYIESSGNNTLRDNNMNSTRRNLYVTGNYDHDIDTSNRVNGGLVYYRYNDSSVSIIEDSVGHVTLYNCSNISIKDNTLVTNGDGIRLIGNTTNVTIDNNVLNNSNYYGIVLSSNQANITNNIIINSETTAISLSNSNNANITNNTVSSSGLSDTSAAGIALVNCDSNDLIINTVTGTGAYGAGIRLSNSESNNLTYNNITGTGSYGAGIALTSSSTNNLTSNTITNSGSHGISLGGSSHIDIIDNTANNNDDGLSLSGDSNYATIRDNNFTGNTGSGIGLSGNSNYATIRYNDIIDNAKGGITIDGGSHSNITYNNILSNDGVSTLDPRSGVTIKSGTDNSVSSNDISYNTLNGIMVASAGNYFSDNTLTLNTDNGIRIQIDNNTFSNNEITIGTNTGYGFYINFGQYDNFIYQSNTVNDESIYYYYDDNTVQTVTREPLTVARVSNVGKISLIKCSNFKIKDNTLSNNKYIDGGVPSGIFLYNSSNITILNNSISGNYHGIHFYNSQNNMINSTNHINTSEDSGIYFDISDYNNITGNNLASNVNCGINFTHSDYNYITSNYINGSIDGILFTTSLNDSIYTNNVTNYSFSAIRLIEYSRNNSMIGNAHTRNGAQFDIYINDSNNNTIAPNDTAKANYTFYLTDDTRLCSLDTEFNKTNVGYEDNKSNLTLMWRIDVLCWDNYHLEPVWANLTVQYGSFTEYRNVTVAEIPLSHYGRLSGNPMGDKPSESWVWGPPNSSMNWLPVIEYKQNISGKSIYQPMNCSAINRWDIFEDKNITYRNITTKITGRGITILVDTGYTPNGKCYYCHMDKLKFKETKHWTNYSSQKFDKLDNSYTPGRCIDCHNETDSISIPHGNTSGKDLLIKQSPLLCYDGLGDQACHNVSATQKRLRQETEFNQTTHHPLGDGNLSCKACHDNHGSNYDSDLLRKYKTTKYTDGYISTDYALCFVCHLEEKLVAKMSGETNSHLKNYVNQTNFRDEYYGVHRFGDPPNPNLVNLHRGPHLSATCYYCHNPHGSGYPAVTRPRLRWTYITNLIPPDFNYPVGDWQNYSKLDQGNWSNSTLNQAGGFSSTGSIGCSCHSSIPTRFTYREFVNYTPAGGAGCLECHDNNASAYNETPIRPIVNLTAIKLAMHTNLSGAFRTGSILQGTDKNFTEWLEYRGYTSENITNITEDNAICWACHCTNGTPPNPYFHPDRALNPYKCAKCHGYLDGQPPHTQGKVRAIDNHGPTTKGAESILIQTDVGSGGSCDDCHYPSRLSEDAIGELKVWKWTKGGWTPYTGRTRNGDVSHYGLNKIQGFNLSVANPLFNTTDCLFCHCNETNGAIWGNATYIADNMYGADTSNVSECYTYCHVRPGWVDSVNESTLEHFHNISIYAGGGPNCTLCHDIESKYGVQSLVNATAIAEGIHGNILNNTLILEAYKIDNKSKPCWGCHQSDGKVPEGMGDRNGITDINEDGVITADELPYTCEDCHARSDAWNSATGGGHTWESTSDPVLGMNRLPPVIYAHYSNSSTVKTNMNGEGTCVDCHNNSFDPNHGDTAYAILGNTILSNVSHYGLNKSQGLALPLPNPLFNTTDCGICHNSSTNATIWGDATLNEHGNFTNYSAEDGCYACHTFDNQTPVDFHAQNLWAGRGGFDCLRCHDTEGYAVRKRINTSIFGQAIHRNLNNASEVGYDYGLNRSCWVCHFENGLNADNHSTRKDPPYLCYDCHNKDAAPFENVSDAPLVYNHFRDGTNITAYQTQNTTSESCMGCHNQSEMFYFYLPDENEATPYYTNFSITSHYGSNRADLVAIFDGSPNSNQYCWYCHLNASTPFMEYVLSKSIVHIGKFDCSDCHGTGRLHSDTLTRPLTGRNCTDCHLEGGGNASTGFSIINKTGFFDSVHSNITGDFSETNYTQLSYVCWGCHVNYSQELTDPEHVTIEPDCSDCHCNATPLNADHLRRIPPQVVQHQPDSNDITTAANCTLCHNMSLVADMPPDSNVTKPTQRNFVSHYARQRTDIIIDGGNASNCTYCHFDGGNEFGAVFANPGSSDIRHGVNCTPCHGYGRIHDATVYGVGDDATLTETYQTSNISTGDIIGEISYTQPYVTLESFNLTWDSGTLELVVVPPAALDAGGMNISEYATTYYNNSTVWNVSGSGTSDRFNANLALNDTTNSTYKFVKVDNPADGNWRFYIVALDANNTSASVTISQDYKVFARCTKCHMETGANAMATNLMINETGFTTGIHQNVTGEFSSTDYFQLSRVCWGCHVNYTGQNASPSHTKPAIELPVCEACHYNSTPLNINYLNITPLQVREHQPLGDEIKTNSSIANCTICHNKSLTITPPDTNIKYPRAKNYISHYGRQRTDMWVTDANNNTITNCSYCHFDGGREFNDVFVLVNNTNITHGVDCVACHGSGRFHDAILKVPVMTEDNDACLYCHNNMSNKQILTAEFGTSAHLNVNCIDCHTPRQVFKGMVVNGESRTYNFSMPSSVTCLNATLEWGGSSILALTLNGPSSTYSGTSINISSPQSGNWNAVVQDVNGDAEFNLTINVTMSHSGSTAKICDECHISGFDDTPLVYKHLTKQSNVPTNATCVLCHANSAYTATAMTTSHYAPTNLIDTKDCIRCHTGIVDGWGNAPDQRNHTDHYFVTGNLANGETWKLVDNYTLTLIETTLRSAMLVLEKDGVLLLRDVVTVGNEFEYEISGMEDDKTSIVNLTVDQVFTAPGHYVVDLSGYILGSHIHRETDNKECYACHDREHRTNIPDGIDYYVLKKVDDNVTLGQMPVNFKENDKKTLRTGEYWDLGENYSLYVEEVSLTKENARMLLYRNETLIEDIILSQGNSFTREEWVLDREIDVFGMTMDNVFISKTTPVIVLSNVWLIAGDQKTLDENTPVTQANTLVKYLPLDSSITVGEEPEDFHAGTIMPGVYSPDCISCHAGNGIAPIKIDIDAFKEGVHPGLNRNATYTSFITDETNKACWACHGNGSSDEPIRHPTPYFGNHTAITCIGCHGDSQFGAKKIYTHYPNAEISTDATCGDCHSNTFTNTTPKNIQASTSHYSTKKDLLNSSLCDTCHNNETNGLIWGKAPQVAKHIADNNCTLCHAGEGTITFHDSGITVTRNCEDCHVNKEQAEKFDLSAIRTHYPGAPEENVDTLKQNYTCRVCHNATDETLHINLEVREYSNESMGYCFACHSVEGKFPHKSEAQIDVLRHGSGIKVISGCEACHSPEGLSKYHTPTLVGKQYFRGTVRHDVNCTSCHEKHEERKYQPYEGIQCIDCHTEYGTAHYVGLPVEMVDITTTCPICHNEEADVFHNLTHVVANVTESAYDPCSDCHYDIESLIMEYDITTIAGTMSRITQPSDATTITCTSCHNATGESRFHYDPYPLGTVQYPDWPDWTDGNVTGCKDCHTYHGGELPFNATNMGILGRSAAGTAHGYSPSCTVCHGGADPISFHTLATSQFIPRLATTIDPAAVPRGGVSLLQVTVVLPQLTKVTRGEYFVDEIERTGYGEPLEYIFNESNDSSVLLGALIDTTDMSYGKHPIFIHVKDSSGKWSKMDVTVLTVEKVDLLATTEIILKDVVPATIFIGVLFFIWRRFK